MAKTSHTIYILKILLVGVLYFVTAKLGLSLAYGTEQVTTVWPPAGIALAVLLLFGPRYWPGIALGAFLANATTNEPALVAASIAVGNTLEVWVGAWWLRRIKFRLSFSHVRDVWIFIGVVLATVLIAAFIGVTSLVVGKVIPFSAFQDTFRVWYLGDVMGILILTPVILLWPRGRIMDYFARVRSGTLAIYAVILFTQLMTYFRTFTPAELLTPRAYQAFPLIIWAAVKTSPFGTALATLMISMIAVIGTTHAAGPFTSQPTVEANLILLQSFLFYVVVTGLTLSSVVAERNRVTKSLEYETSELSQSKASMEGLVLSIGEGLVVVDTNGTIVLVNRVFEKLTGWTAREVVGKPFKKILPIETEEGQIIADKDRLVQRVLKDGKAILSGLSRHPHYYVRRDGQRFPVAASVSPIRVGNSIVGAVNVFRDITQEFVVDRAKDEFVALASHQLRTPLSAIRWYSEMLANEDVGTLNPKQHKYLTNIYSSNQRMIELVNALLNVSRIELGKLSIAPQPTDPVELLESALKDFTPAILAGKLKVVRKFRSGLGQQQLDPHLTRVVLQNIISNSVKYTPSGGQIEISIQKPAAGGVMFTVKDTGLGIPKAQQSKIFTKLFRADNVMKQETTGTGLGLYIAKAVVEQAGGKLAFSSVENKGTTMSVTFPAKGMKHRQGTRGLNVEHS